MFFYSLSAQSQDSITKSLQLKIEKATSDSIKIPLRIALANYVRNSDVEGAKTILNDVLQEIEEHEYSSLYYLKQKADVYNGFGECAQDQSDKAKALDYFLKGVKIAEKIVDSVRMGISYHNLGYLYYGKDDQNKAMYYTNKAIKIRQALGEEYSYDLAMTYNVLGLGFQQFKQPDSALYYLEKARDIDPSENALIVTNSNMAFVYVGLKKYEKAIPLFEESIKIARTQKDYKTLSSHFQNLGYTYRQLKEYDKAIALTDSAIFYAQAIGNKRQLENEYYSRHTIHKLKGDYKKAYEDYKISKTYLDSIHNIEELNRFTALDLNYQFEKEKEVATLALQAEESKKRLYFILLFVVLLLGLFIVYFLVKDKRQKIILAKKEIALKEMEKIQSELTLANRENELKKVVIENSITEEVLNKTLDEIKGIITLESEKERKQALRTLSMSLLTEKSRNKSASSLQSYLDEVHIDFKLHLDKNFSQFNRKEKELISLIKLGLTTDEISKILNTSIASVKSTRYRARKKLGIEPSTDIIEHIEQSL
ncbi:tetratricopeptide repeat protein [Dokdonia ponticola]|uniref:Tetratricopeptide repeat protein n=1 Tax=Dokdonia ponticola TaxID=2041041 RepID=A0ABV9HXY9_9FLAO